MDSHKIVSREEWIEARKAHLANEKAFTRQRDELSRERRALPWVKVEKDYVFDTTSGAKSLADLFSGRSQLLIYHFMFGPTWEEGCPSCSFWADSYQGGIIHLAVRDVTMIAVSKGPLAKLEAYKKRMDWHFEWVSSEETDFNEDYHVTFTAAELETSTAFYNYEQRTFPADEAPGISVFHKAEDGQIYHTYSCYSRGLDNMNVAYQYLDLTPKGRDESALPHSMAWLKRHDMYD